jgi:tetratricopeptide (TPR) repeat protein
LGSAGNIIRAGIFLDLGRIEDAISELDLANSKPKQPEQDNWIHRYRSIAKVLSVQLSEARSLAEQVIAERPRDSLAHFCLGLAHYAARDFALALEELNRAIALDPFSSKSIWLRRSF